MWSGLPIVLLASPACAPRVVDDATVESAKVDANAPTQAEIQAERLGRAEEAYGAGDFGTHVALMTQVVKADPDNHTARYNLACGLARLGDADAAIAHLSVLVDRRMDFGASADPDFRSLRDDPRFVALVARIDALFPTITTSTRVTEIDDFTLRPEGMAWDDVGRRYFVSSVRHAKIVTVTPDGVVADFASLDADGVPVGVLGLEIDRGRGLLWAVGRAQASVEGYQAAHNGVTGVFAVDLATGERRRTLLRPHAGPGPGYNDLTVGPNGDVFVSGAGLSRFPAGSRVPEKVAAEHPLESTNGLTFGADERTLYVSTMDDVIRVDLDAGTSVALTGPPGEQIGFFDGMYYTKGALVGIQLGTRWRAVKLELNPEGDEVVAVRTLEQSNPALSGASTGAVVGRELHYLAQRRPTDAELEHIPDAERGVATKPILMRAPIPDAGGR